jgi:hypothetical protein
MQCKADKVEIMRDLATYEFNFSQNSGVTSGVTLSSKLKMHMDNLIDARVKLQQNVAFDEDGEAFFTDKKEYSDDEMPSSMHILDDMTSTKGEC